jgi:hypothetical protein
MRIRFFLLVLLTALLPISAVQASSLDLSSQARDLLAVQEDLLAFQTANPKSPDYPLTVALSSALRHAQTVLVHVRDLTAILDDYGCNRERLTPRVDTIVTREAIPELRLDLEDINLQTSHMTDALSRDAGIRARKALREAIERVEARWPTDS